MDDNTDPSHLFETSVTTAPETSVFVQYEFLESRRASFYFSEGPRRPSYAQDLEMEELERIASQYLRQAYVKAHFDESDHIVDLVSDVPVDVPLGVRLNALSYMTTAGAR